MLDIQNITSIDTSIKVAQFITNCKEWDINSLKQLVTISL